MRDLVLLAALGVLIPMALFRPWIGVLTWTWIGLMNPHRLTWGFLYTAPVAMIVALATLVGLLLTRERKTVPLTRETVVLTLLLIHFTLTTLFAWNPDGAWYQWEKVMKILLFTYVTMILIHGRERIRWMMIVVAGSIGFYGFKGGIFSLINGGQYTIWGPEGSFIDGNNEIGLAMIMVWPLLVMLATDAVKWIRLPFLGAAWLTPISIVFTYSRGAMLGLVATLVPVFWRAKRRWLWLLLAVPIGFAAAAWAPEELFKRAETISTYEQDNSAMQRIQAWSVSWNVARHRPLLGSGFGLDWTPDSVWISYASFLGEWNNRARAAHSIYFQVMGEHGLLGFGLFILLLSGAMLKLGRIRREANRSEATRWIGRYANGLQLGLIGYSIAGAFLSLAYFDLFYTFVALAVILQRELKAQAAAVPSHSAQLVTAVHEPVPGIAPARQAALHRR